MKTENTYKSVPKNNLIGSGTEPVVLDAAQNLDIDTKGLLVDAILDSGLSGGFNSNDLEKFTTIANTRESIYQLIDTMAKDSTVSAIIRTYSEDACEPADNGRIVWAESDDPQISKFVNYLLNVMNVDKNVFSWAYCLIKYGDLYLRLFRESDYDDELFNKAHVENALAARTTLTEAAISDIELGVGADQKSQKAANGINESINIKLHSPADQYSYYVEMVADPGSMFELTKYGKTYGYIETPSVTTGLDMSEVVGGANSNLVQNYRMRSGDVNIYQADEFVHACLEDNANRFPEQVELFSEKVGLDGKVETATAYKVRRGKSFLFDSYKVWREKSLLENSAILNRVTRSSIVRKIGVEVGDMPKEKVKLALRQVKELIETKSSVSANEGMSEYTNPGPIENNIYYATKGGIGNISIEAVGGDIDVRGLADLDWWNNKFYSSYGIPKQYFGWTDDGAGFNGGSALTVLSSVYAKGVKRIQNALSQAITDCINLFLLNRGCQSYLNNFTIKMRAPVTQEEVSYREALSNRINAINNMQSLFTDIEDRATRLEITRELVASLNYGDGILSAIDSEIKLIKEQKAQEAEALEEAEAQAELDAAEALKGELPVAGEIAALENIAPNIEGDALLEVINAEVAYLPTPEELNK